MTPREELLAAHFQVVCESDRFQDGSAGWQRALEHLNALKLCYPDAAEALDREAARFGGDWTRLHGAP